jgi:hypothetical protein
VTRDGGGTAEWALAIVVIRVYLSACEIRLKVLVGGDLFRVLSTNSKQAFCADLIVGR